MSAAHALPAETSPSEDRLSQALDSFTHLAGGHPIADAFTVHGAQKLRTLMSADARHWLATLEKCEEAVRHPAKARTALERFLAIVSTVRWEDSDALAQLRVLAREILAAIGVVYE